MWISLNIDNPHCELCRNPSAQLFINQTYWDIFHNSSWHGTSSKLRIFHNENKHHQ
ncbi:hypothetical protein EMIT0P2_100066 [Pseudomonas sp. IT-P2]